MKKSFYKLKKRNFMVDTDKLKELDIKDVWQALGFELPRGNSNARCFSPAHKNGDRNPSLAFDKRTNRYKCFTCDNGGDTIALVQQAEGLDFREASRWLADKFNVDIGKPTTEQVTPRYIDRPNTPRVRPEPSLEPIRNQTHNYTLNEPSELYRAFYSYTDDPSPELVAWWRKRGLSDGLLKRVGWRTITKATYQKIAKDYSVKELVEAGLITERANGYAPVFYKHSVVVPFYDDTQVIAIRARALDPTVKAKYLAPKGTSPPIYNYQAMLDYDDTKPLYITESETDALALAEMGETALALVGGKKHYQSLVVRELVHLVVNGFNSEATVRIATDRDETGEGFYTNVAKALYLGGLPADKISKYTCEHQEHKDIAECLANNNRTPERVTR